MIRQLRFGIACLVAFRADLARAAAAIILFIGAICAIGLGATS